MNFRLLLLVASGTILLLVSCQTVSKVTAKQAIGMVFDIAGRGDHAYNDSAYKGLVELARSYHGWIQDDPDKIDFGSELQIQYLQPGSNYEREADMRALAENGYSLVYCVGFNFSGPMERISKEFPDVHFVVIDAYVPNLTKASNLTCLSFKENEGAFIVGAIAALKADGAPIGFLGGKNIPIIHRFQNGFAGGAIYADRRYSKRGMLLAQYIGTTDKAFVDPDRGYLLAHEMFEQGAAVIFHAAGASGAGLFRAAAEANKMAIGVDIDEGLICESSADAEIRARGTHILTSMIKRVDIAVVLSGRKFLDSSRQMDGGYWAIGLKDGGLDFATNQYNEPTLAKVDDRVHQIETDVINGKVEIPDISTDMPSWANSLD